MYALVAKLLYQHQSTLILIWFWRLSIAIKLLYSIFIFLFSLWFVFLSDCFWSESACVRMCMCERVFSFLFFSSEHGFASSAINFSLCCFNLYSFPQQRSSLGSNAPSQPQLNHSLIQLFFSAWLNKIQNGFVLLNF